MFADECRLGASTHARSHRVFWVPALLPIAARSLKMSGPRDHNPFSSWCMSFAETPPWTILHGSRQQCRCGRSIGKKGPSDLPFLLAQSSARSLPVVVMSHCGTSSYYYYYTIYYIRYSIYYILYTIYYLSEFR